MFLVPLASLLALLLLLTFAPLLVFAFSLLPLAFPLAFNALRFSFGILFPLAEGRVFALGALGKGRHTDEGE